MSTPAHHQLHVARIQRFCLHDGPGIRTTVFTQGCSLRCWWCHNPDTRLPQNPAARNWTVPDLVEEVERDARYWSSSAGGVTISGGECLIQPDALAAFLAELGRRGHDRCIETAGAVPTGNVARVSPHVDRWLYDLKALDPARFEAGTRGPDAGLPVRNLCWLLGNSDAPVTVRIPLIGGFNAGTDEPARIADLLADLPRRVTVEILPGHAVGCELSDTDPTPEARPGDVEAALDAFHTAQIEVTVQW